MNFPRKKFHYLPEEEFSDSNSESGQTFIEFILLLLIMITLSMGMVGGFNNTVGKQWRALVKAISLPNSTNDFEI
ncbi:MAG: hypothetical protein CME63_18165 [Halobacteriovoraceae bacterium]|nr:hypothetical protein [Halobacteriovoraceae bacterium]MBC99675.1 hypothetical protein [Halobacteriovoraceae bacterium]|tara:strand:+ start:2555 stop:2779 length:225 start_codon:yes stop_codon:yes gene_type:complete